MTFYVMIAAAHHILAFTLVAILVLEFVLIRSVDTAKDVQRLASVDLWYGILAGLLIAIGLVRVYYGESASASDYWGNWIFVTKFALFIIIGLASLPPTIAFIRWNRKLKAGGSMPEPVQINTAKRWIELEVALIAVVIVCAAMLGRSLGFS
jgi:putative membrane protein